MGKLIYNLFIIFYPLAIRIASVFNGKARLWIRGRKEAGSIVENFPAANQNAVWFHCSSLGEFEQARPLIEAIKAKHPGKKIVLTFFSPSGYEIQKNYPLADVIMYLPMDSPSHAKFFINKLRPSLAIFIKYEYWHYYLSELRQQNLPLVLVSGIFRKDQAFFKSYGSFYRNMLSCFTHFFVQNHESATLLKSLGIDNCTIAGDTRFDRVMEIAGKFSEVEGISRFCGNDKVFVAGSTWLEDDKELAHFANAHKDIKFIIAPHDIGSGRVGECLELYKNSITYSTLLSSISNESGLILSSHILIIDNIGMLSRLYKYARICLIGGGFGGDGVHNVLEAAVYGKPVIYGPVYEKYQEAIDLVDLGAGFVTHAVAVGTPVRIEV